MKAMERGKCAVVWEQALGVKLEVGPVDSAERLWLAITIYVYICCI